MYATIGSLHKSIEKTNEWLQALVEIGEYENKEQAYTVLRAVLHIIRDRLTVDLAAHLAAQMPVLLKGVYYEGWHPAKNPTKQRSAEAFLSSLEQEFRRCNINMDVSCALIAVLELLESKMPDEMRKIKRQLPEEIRAIWDDVTSSENAIKDDLFLLN